MEDYYMEGEMPNYEPEDSLQIAPSFSPPSVSASDPLAVLVSSESHRFMDGAENMYVSNEEQCKMMRSIEEIFDSEEGQDEAMGDGNIINEDDDEGEGEEVVDLEDQHRRTVKLGSAIPSLARLWWGDEDGLDRAAEKLADGSRDPKWRIPIGDSGILNFFLEMLSANTLRHTLNIHVLRLIGNSCADTDENRARVVSSNHLPSIIIQLRDTSLLPFAIPVLYNICIDYEPAQLAASNSYLGKELIDLLSGPRLNDSRAFLGYTCKLLNLLAQQPSEPELAPDQAAIVLMRIACDREKAVDLDDFIALGNAAIAYLQHEKFQKAVIAQGAMIISLALMLHSYTRFDSHPLAGEASPDEEEAKVLQQMRSSLNQVLSDISALPEFTVAFPVTSSFTSSLRRWLSSPQLQLQTCACIMLGNLARSDAACEEFVHTAKVHIPLIAVLNTANDSQLLHAALGFLKNLALPLKNKAPLGDAGLFDVLPRLWLLDVLQQIQFSSISLTRQLINNTYENVHRICKRLSPDEDSPANMRTKLSLLIALFERTDVEPIKMEIARLITAVVRVFQTYPNKTQEELTAIRVKFLTVHPDVGRPLSFMVSQSKWPVVRSEGWFVFALLASNPEGAQCISDMMQDVTVFQPLVELLTGKNLIDYNPSPSTDSELTATSPGVASLEFPSAPPGAQSPEGAKPHAQAEEMSRLDRENALVLVSELLKNRGSEMALMRRTLFEDLLKGGGEIVMSYRESKNIGPRGERPRAGKDIQQVMEHAIGEIS